MRAFTLGSIAIIAAAIGTIGAVAHGQSGGSDPHNRRQCFFQRDVNGFAAPNQDVIYVNVGVRDVYRLDVLGGCPNIDWTMRMGLRSFPGGDWLCTGDQAEVIVPDPGMGSQRCQVRIGRRLTPEEVKALPKRGRP